MAADIQPQTTSLLPAHNPGESAGDRRDSSPLAGRLGHRILNRLADLRSEPNLKKPASPSSKTLRLKAHGAAATVSGLPGAWPMIPDWLYRRWTVIRAFTPPAGRDRTKILAPPWRCIEEKLGGTAGDRSAYFVCAALTLAWPDGQSVSSVEGRVDRRPWSFPPKAAIKVSAMIQSSSPADGLRCDIRRDGTGGQASNQPPRGRFCTIGKSFPPASND